MQNNKYTMKKTKSIYIKPRSRAFQVELRNALLEGSIDDFPVMPDETIDEEDDAW